jgi:hypothetical protein
MLDDSFLSLKPWMDSQIQSPLITNKM